MAQFKSSREKYLWLWAFAVFVSIYATLFIGQPLLELFSNQNVQAVLFILGMIIIGIVIILHSLKTRPKKEELVILMGIVAVYIMLFLRLGLPERSHLMEYSVLAIFIHMAFIERYRQRKKVLKPAILTFGITFLIGVLDECIQIVIPNRVFDIADIMFNGIAAFMAIGARLMIHWIRKKI